MGTTTEQGTPQAATVAQAQPEQGNRVDTRSPAQRVNDARKAGKLPAWATHSNPRVALVLGGAALGMGKGCKSMAELGRLFGVRDVPTMRTARQVLRDAGMGVGHGHTYTNAQPDLAKAARTVAKQRAQAAKAAKAGAQAK